MQASESECSNGQGYVRNEQKILSRIISRIHDLKLIAEIEKQNIVEKTTPLEIKGELYDLLTKKDSKAASKILNTIRIVNNCSIETLLQEGASDNNEPLGNDQKNPLKIDLILKETFRFLNLNDMKNCRLVCKKWDNVAEPLVRQLSKIVFLRTRHNSRKNTDPVAFNETFQDCGTAVPFTSFSFRSLNGEKDSWAITEIRNFVEQHGRNVKELEFHNLGLIDDLNVLNNGFPDYDMSPWISGLPIQKLVINCFDFLRSQNLTVNLSQLHGVKKLRLRNIYVNCELGVKLSLSELEFEDVTYCDGKDNELKSCHLNNYLNFNDTKKVLIKRPENAVTLDLKDFTNVDEFNLKGCTIVNWGISQCSVEKMKLTCIPLSEKTTMKVKELHLKNSSIDLVALPQQIEKFKWDNLCNAEVSCSQPINFPNLSFIFLRTTRIKRILSHFRNCPQLVDIHIRNTFTEETTLHLDWVPTSVRRLKLEGDIDVENENGPLHLDTLVLEKSQYVDCTNITRKFRPQNLVIIWREDLDVYDNADLFRSQFKVYVGPFHWKKNSFAKSLLAMYVDREAEYYLFQDQMGKAIDVNEFNSRNFNL